MTLVLGLRGRDDTLLVKAFVLNFPKRCLTCVQTIDLSTDHKLGMLSYAFVINFL